MSLNDELLLLPECTFYPMQDLKSFTTMRLAAVGDLVEVRSIAGLQRLLPLLRKHGRNYLVVGWGANQILPSRCQDMILHLDFPFDQAYLDSAHEEYILPASLGLNHLTAHASRFGLSGWEVFTGIPASLGGAVFMNAGTNLGEIGRWVKEVKLVNPEGNIRMAKLGPESFSYRHNHFVQPGEVIVEVTMVHQGLVAGLSEKIKAYLDFRKKTQPLATRNCGCVFKNPRPELPAGKLIDLLALKNFQVGALRISPRHANFVENTGEGTGQQLKTLIELVKFEMDHFYGIEFEMEVKIPYH